jgi:hypothetical protein
VQASPRRSGPVREVVERGNAVGFGPDADGTGPCNPLIVDLDVALAVERDPDVLAGELDAERVPLVAGYRGVDILDRVPATILRVVQRDVVLQRIGARNIVVVAVFPTLDNATGLGPPCPRSA